MAISLDQTPAEGGEPAGSFCNLSLTWTQKTKVILSAAETQLPFMLPPGPGAACSPALRPLCPGGGLWPPSPIPSSPVAVPGEAFGLARRTLALSSPALAASVQRAWSPGPPAQSVQKLRTAPLLPAPASARAKAKANGSPEPQFPLLSPGVAAMHQEEALAPKQATSF